MAANTAAIIIENKGLLLERYRDIEWPDDVTDLRCVRCHRVAINHCVSSCQHVYCNDCGKGFSDGRHEKCDQCQKHVTEMEKENMIIEYKLGKTRVSCPNKKYGCQLENQLIIVAKHLKNCENTMENDLPVECTEANTMEILYKHMNALSEQLTDEMRAMKNESEANWKQMQAKMHEMELKVDDNMDQLNRDLDGFKTEMILKTETLFTCEMQPNGNGEASDKKIMPMMEEMRNEIEKLKVKQTKLSRNAKQDLKDIYTMNGGFIQRLDKAEEKIKKKLNQYQTQIKNVIVAYETEKTMDTNIEVDTRTKGRMDTKIRRMNEDLQKQNEQLITMEREEKDERNREMEKLKTIRVKMKQRDTSIRADLTAQAEVLEEYQQQLQEPTTSHRISQDEDAIRLRMALIEAEVKAVPALPVLSNQVIQINTEVYEWKIKKLSDQAVERKTDVFPIQGYPFGLQLKLCLGNNGNTRILHRLIDVLDSGRPITQSMPKIIYILHDQTADDWDVKRDLIIYHDYGFAKAIKYADFTGPRLLVDHSKLLDAPYNKDDCIKIKILVEPPSIANSFASNDGVLYWRVDNYRERKRMEEEGLVKYQESPYFYTAPQGYRAGALITLNTMMTGVDVYKGKYDDELSQHFKHRVTITLFNQTDPSINLVKSCDHNVLDDVHLHKLCQPSEMENPGYVKNDSMLLKFVVEPLPN